MITRINKSKTLTRNIQEITNLMVENVMQIKVE